MKIDLEHADLRALSDIAVAFEKTARFSYPTVVVARFSGVYRYGSAGNPDASFMTAMCQAAIAAWEPEGMVLDLSGLNYQWGDMLEQVFSIGPRVLDDHFSLVVVCSDLNREAVRTLVHGVNSTKPFEDISWACDSRSDALTRLAEMMKAHGA